MLKEVLLELQTHLQARVGVTFYKMCIFHTTQTTLLDITDDQIDQSPGLSLSSLLLSITVNSLGTGPRTRQVCNLSCFAHSFFFSFLTLQLQQSIIRRYKFYATLWNHGGYSLCKINNCRVWKNKFPVTALMQLRKLS